MPFPTGENIKYNVRWEMVKAGKASFRVLDFTDINGEKAYRFVLEIKSNRYIDIFYKIKDRHEGFTDFALTRSLLYQKIQNGKDKRDVKVVFDQDKNTPDKNTAEYSNFGNKRDSIKIPANTFDPLSAFYKMRTFDFKAGQNLSFPVSNGKKHFLQKASIIRVY